MIDSELFEVDGELTYDRELTPESAHRLCDGFALSITRRLIVRDGVGHVWVWMQA